MPVIGNVFDKMSALRQPGVITALQGLSELAKTKAASAAAEDEAANQARGKISIEIGADGQPTLHAKDVPLSDPGAKLDDVISGINEGVMQNLQSYRLMLAKASDAEAQKDLGSFGGRFRASMELGANPVGALIDAIRVRADGPGGRYSSQLQTARALKAQAFFKENIDPAAQTLFKENDSGIAIKRYERLLGKDNAAIVHALPFHQWDASQDLQRGAEAIGKTPETLTIQERAGITNAATSGRAAFEKARASAAATSIDKMDLHDVSGIQSRADIADVVDAKARSTPGGWSTDEKSLAARRLGGLFTEYQKLDARQRGMLAAQQRTAQAIVTKKEEADSIAEAIMNGDQPPDLTGMSRDGTATHVRSALADAGFNLSRAQLDWKATQQHIKTLNGPQQTRLRQAVDATYDQLDVVDRLYDEWKKEGAVSGIRLFNRASLATAKNLPGKAGAAAQALEGQLSLLTGELGNTLMGGNSPTDHALTLAQSMLSGDWNDATFKKAIGNLRTDLKIRRNSITNSDTAGASANNPYAPKTEAKPGGRVVTDTNEILGIFGKGKKQ